jgi:hypothetical protein
VLRFVSAWRAILYRPSTTGHPLSAKAKAWALSLLETCEWDHVFCKDTNRALLPKRLLKLKQSEDGIFVRLLEDENFCDRYFALSHCWGNAQSCITTLDDLEERKEGIDWDELPKTFQDAIQYTLMLGVEYIWIDSLCILQDDEEDWEIESSKMADGEQPLSKIDLFTDCRCLQYIRMHS